MNTAILSSDHSRPSSQILARFMQGQDGVVPNIPNCWIDVKVAPDSLPITNNDLMATILSSLCEHNLSVEQYNDTLTLETMVPSGLHASYSIFSAHAGRVPQSGRRFHISIQYHWQNDDGHNISNDVSKPTILVCELAKIEMRHRGAPGVREFAKCLTAVASFKVRDIYDGNDERLPEKGVVIDTSRYSKSGIDKFSTSKEAITVTFSSGDTYVYTYASAGRKHVEQMKRLAKSGNGLNAYINANVRDRYAQKL